MHLRVWETRNSQWHYPLKKHDYQGKERTQPLCKRSHSFEGRLGKGWSSLVKIKQFIYWGKWANGTREKKGDQWWPRMVLRWETGWFTYNTWAGISPFSAHPTSTGSPQASIPFFLICTCFLDTVTTSLSLCHNLPYDSFQICISDPELSPKLWIAR